MRSVVWILSVVLVILLVFFTGKYLSFKFPDFFSQEVLIFGKSVEVSTLVVVFEVVIFLFLILLTVLRFLKAKREVKEFQKVSLRELQGRADTDMDRLYDLVRNGPVKLSLAAKKFKLPENVVLGWAKILEDHGLISIEYPMFGDIVLKEKVEKKGEGEKKDKGGEEGNKEANVKVKSKIDKGRRKTKGVVRQLDKRRLKRAVKKPASLKKKVKRGRKTPEKGLNKKGAKKRKSR